MNVIEYAALQHEYDDTLAHLWHVERDGVHFLLYFKGGGSLSYDAKAAGTEAEISRAFDQEIVRFKSGTYHNEVWEVVSETIDEDSARYLKIFDHPTFGIDWEKVSGSISDEDQFCDMLEKQIKSWKGTSHSMPVASHPYWPKFHKMVKTAVSEEYGNSIRLYRGIHGDQAPDILAGIPVKTFSFSSWTSDLSSARVYAAGKTKRGDRDWVVIRRNFSPEEIAFAPVTLSGPCENPDILMRLMYDVEHPGDEFIVSLSQLVPGDYKIAAQPKGTKESFLREYVRELLIELALPSMQWVDTDLGSIDPEVLDRIWDMYTNTYLSMGMDLSASNAAGLKKYKGVFLIDVDTPPDGVPDAFIIYKPTAFGNKMALLGTCQEERCLGKREAKSAVVSKMFDLLNGGGFFIEAGEKIEEILRSSSVPPVCDEEKIKEFLGPKFIRFLDDCYYERKLAMATAIVTKRIYGSFA